MEKGKDRKGRDARRILRKYWSAGLIEAARIHA